MIRASDVCLRVIRSFEEQPGRYHDLIIKEVHAAEALLNSVVLCPLEQHQQDAIVCWAMAVLNGVQGPEAGIQESALVKNLNIRHYQMAAGEFSKWFLRNGVIDQKQMRQRNAEQRLFLTGKLVTV
jgi:GH24 family phage-related lysozyme (muramidase)